MVNREHFGVRFTRWAMSNGCSYSLGVAGRENSKKIPFLRANFMIYSGYGVLAHLARALRWQRRGEEFESPVLHQFIDVL